MSNVIQLQPKAAEQRQPIDYADTDLENRKPPKWFPVSVILAWTAAWLAIGVMVGYTIGVL